MYKCVTWQKSSCPCEELSLWISVCSMKWRGLSFDVSLFFKACYCWESAGTRSTAHVHFEWLELRNLLPAEEIDLSQSTMVSHILTYVLTLTHANMERKIWQQEKKVTDYKLLNPILYILKKGQRLNNFLRSRSYRYFPLRDTHHCPYPKAYCKQGFTVEELH